MTNEEKEKALLQYDNLIHSIQKKYTIHGYTYEELHQELLTHLWCKLNKYDKDKSALSTFISMIVNNKLKNMFNNRRNVKEICIGLGMNIEKSKLAPQEETVISIANEMLKKHKHKEVLFEVMSGRKILDIADDYALSANYVGILWKEFIERIREESGLDKTKKS